MAEAAFRIPVAPVQRGSSRAWFAGDPLGIQRPGIAPPMDELEAVAVRATGRRDGVVAAVATLVLALLVLKPWGDGATPTSIAAAQRVEASGRAALVRTRLPVPAEAFAPPPSGCLDDAGWRVCLIGSAERQTIRNTFDPERPPLRPAGAPGPRSAPAALILTAGGGGLVFFPPATGREAAGGSIVVSAWLVDGSESTGSIDLRALGSLRRGAAVAPNVQLTAGEDLVAARLWPNGRYVIRLQAANGAGWDQFFAIDVASARGLVEDAPAPQ